MKNDLILWIKATSASIALLSASVVAFVLAYFILELEPPDKGPSRSPFGVLTGIVFVPIAETFIQMWIIGLASNGIGSLRVAAIVAGSVCAGLHIFNSWQNVVGVLLWMICVASYGVRLLREHRSFRFRYLFLYGVHMSCNAFSFGLASLT